MATTEQVEHKVLRRVQVSKMTRALQDRLALANIKIKHGWEKLSIETLEPQIQQLKRKRPGSSNGPLSDTSSVISDRFMPMGALDLSPLTMPMFSDDAPRSGSSYGGRKRLRYQGHMQQYPASSSHNRVKVKGPHGNSTSWKSSLRLPESSPAYHNRHVRYSDSSHLQRLSFISETSTIRDRSPSLTSEQDDEDLPTMSFQQHIHSSPPRIPRTPSPDVARSARLRSKPFPNEHTKQNGEDSGADLLMFLAASPSPAVPKNTRTPRSTNNPPTTPPPKSTPLPSSMMSTPGGGATGFLGFGVTTPGMAFNFSDYLNVTPSPAQAAWRTPAAGKTPLAARDARRRLNFDNLMPPSGDSPRIGHGESKLSGLGMELGGELVSSQ